MSLPPGFLDELRSRTTLSRVVGRKVVWDLRKSNQAKGDFWAPCPFHQEKSASFHVDDRKGFYYCFGCQAKGDALSFLRETESMSFIEAVEALAREAGMTMPAADPAAARRADRRGELAQVMDEAVRHYRLQLKTQGGAAARDYLARRRLDAAAQDRFEIGFAPDSRQGLFKALTGRGIAADLLLAAGLCAEPEGGGAPYDRFRDRIIFPIRDARGRCTGLGGRAMDPNARAKYLNSPETELFDKGRSLYNHGPAREAAAKGQALIVAEGYMDVIALVGAGFAAAVAPLGTAITEPQLRLIWAIHPEPVIMLDGDRAGIGAAMRLVDLALPLIEAGQGLRFVILPEGMDPDELIGSRGPAAMAALIAAAVPMVALLWRRETEGRDFDSPERRATLDKSLRAVVRRISDPSIRGHYAEEIRRLRWQLFGAGAETGRGNAPAGRGGKSGQRAAGFGPGGAMRDRSGRGRIAGPVEPGGLPGTRASLLAAAPEPGVEDYLREAMILAVAITHPVLVTAFEDRLAALDMRDPGHARLRQAVLSAAMDDSGPALDDPEGIAAFRDRLDSAAGADLEKLMRLAHVRIAPPVRRDDDADFARLCLAEELARLEARRGIAAEVRDAVEDIGGLADEGLTWRLGRAAEAGHRSERPPLAAADGDGDDSRALSAQLQGLIDGAAWEKKKG
ncbi:MAG: DNA primase [Alphaproteobacteria bacterium HGW-Alphaproteobacteria-6]|nr:MAG: DNA primase [Alphaproteobacteria bacterium HGW-Alphaproteobacteria-6]